ncbi:hypothetical protein H105_08218 [Trichophyton soudanense CBS 452.61]|uniref:Uncharacterized protein n=1 Tax=Trichophyton soudanense CBS 452.61 TaxID=1215331 RepID=A0A022XF65_TRISD|nr:hypothetical protein H105_08218 [Trichophyton soudanense CBS 452.61]
MGAFRPIMASSRPLSRQLSTLSNNPHIYGFPNATGTSHTLSLLPTSPPTPDVAIGSTTTSALPPTPTTFSPNPRFISILDSVLADHAYQDPDTVSAAQVMASAAGANLFSRLHGRAEGAGSAGRGGFIHIADSRELPEYGRIPSPEDIFGSIEVDGQGNIEGKGNYQSSGTYRIVTRSGILGLSPFLREKLVERLKAEEQKIRQ